MRRGRKPPQTDRISMNDGGVIYDGTVLYADIVDSTALGESFGSIGAAKIIQSCVVGVCRLVSDWNGVVTAYDGDRVMAVFGGDDQENNAVSCAFSLAYLVEQVLNPLINEAFRLPSTARHLRCCCGIDTGEMLAVKIGLRGNTDLLWSGRPANYAAKLCAHRKPARCTVVTGRVFQRLDADLKRSNAATYWQRFTCAAIKMEVFGSNAVLQIKGV
ncbi:MAG: adenylate/guanylate cyclase domain-containing protein [Phycisphaerae bacterium]